MDLFLCSLLQVGFSWENSDEAKFQRTFGFGRQAFPAFLDLQVCKGEGDGEGGRLGCEEEPMGGICCHGLCPLPDMLHGYAPSPLAVSTGRRRHSG